MGIALALPAMSSGGAARDLLAFGAACSVLCVIVSAWPMHYEQGLGGQAESDGMAVWRILTGGPPRPLVKRKPKKDKDIVIARPGYLIALGLLLLLAFALRPKFGFELLGLFAAAVLFQVWVERSP
jgi:hypothetical protein